MPIKKIAIIITSALLAYPAYAVAAWAPERPYDKTLMDSDGDGVPDIYDAMPLNADITTLDAMDMYLEAIKNKPVPFWEEGGTLSDYIDERLNTPSAYSLVKYGEIIDQAITMMEQADVFAKNYAQNIENALNLLSPKEFELTKEALVDYYNPEDFKFKLQDYIYWKETILPPGVRDIDIDLANAYIDLASTSDFLVQLSKEAVLDLMDKKGQAEAFLKTLQLEMASALVRASTDVFNSVWGNIAQTFKPTTDSTQYDTEIGKIIQIDPNLDWFNLQDRISLNMDILSLGLLPSLKWVNSSSCTSNKLVEAYKEDAKFIFTSGINTSGLTQEQVETLARSFNIPEDKSVAFFHSHATESGLKSLLEAEEKPDFLVFASPRCSRDTFERIIKEAGYTKDQVMVITASGDLPHWPEGDNTINGINPLNPVALGASVVNAIAGLANNASSDYGDKQSEYYTYVELKKDVTAEDLKIGPILGHESMIEGVLENHVYDILVDGKLKKNKRISEEFASFVKEK